MRRKRRRSNVQLPWQSEGWFTDSLNDDRDARLDQELRQFDSSNGQPRERRASVNQGLVPLFNNPYLNLIPISWALGTGVFLFAKVEGILGVLALSFFSLVAVVVIIHSLAKVRRWHVQRRKARDHIRKHGGKLPPELRWYT